jgi:uncharacterized protein YdaU (DUF1376 family)
MLSRKSLPDNDSALARILGVDISEWAVVASSVRPFFKSRDGRLIHQRCEDELRAQDQKMERFSDRGKKGAAARYNRDNEIAASSMLLLSTEHNITGHNKEIKRQKGLGEEKKMKDDLIPDGMHFLEVESPEHKAWSKLRRWPERDIRVDGRIQRGWIFPSPWPSSELKPKPNGGSAPISEAAE